MKTKQQKQCVIHISPEIPVSDSTQQIIKAVNSGLQVELKAPDFTQHTKVGDIGIEVVASIAAHFPLEIDAPAAIRRAYQLLKFASAGRRGEVSLSGYEEGIQSLLDTHQSIAGIVEWQKSLPPDLFQALPSDVTTAQLDDVLANLMPRHAVTARLPLFKRWLTVAFLGTDEDDDLDKLCHEAEVLIAQWRKEGVPEVIYLRAREEIQAFLRHDKHLKLSRNGKAGAAAKKSKQGRVKKKTDKRIGSRLPGKKSTRAKK